jgi:hypothetical protein
MIQWQFGVALWVLALATPAVAAPCFVDSSYNREIRMFDDDMARHPDIQYFNAESRMEIDLELAAVRHRIMITAYLSKCTVSRNKPSP